MGSTSQLLEQRLWAPEAYPDGGTAAERIKVSYLRARSLVKHLGMTVDDVATLSPKFWAFHSDFIGTADSATATILTIHWNLCMGTIASYAPQRPDLSRVLVELQEFDSCGEFMLTEVGHGLDARNIETTATRDSDGSFDLHTPSPEAAKIMPPTTLHAGLPRVAVVFARLVVDGEKRSMRPFLVRIASHDSMARGVTSRMLPPRPGAKAIDHALTTFNHVRLDASALLGNIEEPLDPHQDFLRQIHRVTVGTLALSIFSVPYLRLAGYILGRYSLVRCVAEGKTARRIPIVRFSTQHTPILVALTLAAVLEAFADDVRVKFCQARDPHIKSALACVFKQTATQAGSELMSEMVDRCGWQGLYSHNQIVELGLAMRGNTIAEGDILVLCIRLASELLLGRYAMPKPQDPTCLLAQHEAGVWKEASDMLIPALSQAGSHRSELFNSLILPRSRMLIQATGDRMAYEAALSSGKVAPDMLRLYEETCILRDSSWYVEHLGLSRSDLFGRHAEAVGGVLPRLSQILEETGAEKWATAPILSAEGWKESLAGYASCFESLDNDVVAVEDFPHIIEKGEDGCVQHEAM